MKENNLFSSQAFEEGINILSDLSEGEFHKDINDIVISQEEELAFKQIGRLLCVWIKQPFSESFYYDPDIPWNWAKSFRAWEIREPISNSAKENSSQQFELLSQFAQEWDRPVHHLAEFNIFLSICKRIRPFICNENKVFEQAEKVGKELVKSGHKVSIISLNDLIGVGALSVGTYLIQNVSFLSSAPLPIVAGLIVLLSCYGQRKFCLFLKDFEESYDPNKDRFGGAFQCNSKETKNGLPCKNPVNKEGRLCWRHQPIGN